VAASIDGKVGNTSIGNQQSIAVFDDLCARYDRRKNLPGVLRRKRAAKPTPLDLQRE
jgi:hypothetical protein